MIKIFLVRHGETEWNKIGKMQGWGNSDLSDFGRNQALWLSERIKDLNIDKIYTSPTGRAYETATIARGDLDIEIIKDDSMREINVGQWEGLDKEIVEEKFKEGHFNFWNCPDKYIPSEGGEDFFQVRNRVFNGFMDIIKDKENQGKTILIVSHAIAIKSLLCKLENIEVKDFWYEPIVKQTSVTEIDFLEDRLEIILKGDISHYKQLV